jgi:hypothetical protein
MLRKFLKLSLPPLVLVALLSPGAAARQSQPAPGAKPLTSQELARMLNQLPANPARRDELIEALRTRGIGFELTSGMRSLAATRSGNDSLLRRTLEEAERRRANPRLEARPTEAEGREVWERTRKATLEAVAALPDFVVKQLVTRYQARERTRAWQTLDRLTVAVSYRESSGGEQYKLLAVNGIPEVTSGVESASYRQAGGSTTTGEFASTMLRLFSEESETKYKAVDTDTLRGRRTLVFDFEIAKDKARGHITYGDERTVSTGLAGKVWIDRELGRVLRVEMTYTEIDPDFPVKSLEKRVDYDWVTIAEERHLLPVAADAIFTAVAPVTYYNPQSGRTTRETQLFQSRNEIRFRNYQKFGTEVKIIEDDDFPAEPPPDKP